MKLIFVTCALSFCSLAASASDVPAGRKLATCEPTRIVEYPGNAKVDLIQSNDDKLFLVVTANFYGVTFPEVFEVTAVTEGNLLVYSGKNRNATARSTSARLELKESGKGRLSFEPGAAAELVNCRN